MEASANVETDLESVSFTDDKESDKISDTIVRLDDDVEASKTDVEESFELINNSDVVGDTDKSDGTNITSESVSPSKDIISLESNVSFDTSEQIVENTVSNNEGIETGQPSNNDADAATGEQSVSINTDDDNLMDEIHSGDFNAASSPISKSSGHLHTSIGSVEDSFEILENDAIEDEIEEEQDIEEEEEKHRINQQNHDEDAIEIIDDDEDDEEDDVDDDSDDNDEEDSSDESIDNSDKDENNDYDHKDDDDISTLSSEGGDDVKIMTAKVPMNKPKTKPRKEYKNEVSKNLVRKSIKM